MQLSKPKLCRFWLAALVSALTLERGSKALGAATALHHLARFVFQYTLAAVPPHLAQHIDAFCRLYGNRHLMCGTAAIHYLMRAHIDAAFSAEVAGSRPPVDLELTRDRVRLLRTRMLLRVQRHRRALLALQ